MICKSEPLSKRKRLAFVLIFENKCHPVLRKSPANKFLQGIFVNFNLLFDNVVIRDVEAPFFALSELGGKASFENALLFKMNVAVDVAKPSAHRSAVALSYGGIERDLREDLLCSFGRKGVFLHSND